MKILHLVDMSPFIYAGAWNKRAEIQGPIVDRDSKYDFLTKPSGGVAFIFNLIHKWGYLSDFIFIADRLPTEKLKLYMDYKAGRTWNVDVSEQKDLAEYILNDCGYNVLSAEGYEADDIIFTLCNKYKSKYDKVIIHTDDADLYICIDDNVEANPARTNGKIVTKENFSRVVSNSKYFVEYNTLPLLKMIYGDNSDNIKPLSKDMQIKAKQLFSTDFFKPRFGKKEFIRANIESFMPELLPRFELIYPLDVDIDIDFTKVPDKAKVFAWASAVGNKKFPYVENLPPSIKSKIKSLFE